MAPDKNLATHQGMPVDADLRCVLDPATMCVTGQPVVVDCHVAKSAAGWNRCCTAVIEMAVSSSSLGQQAGAVWSALERSSKVFFTMSCRFRSLLDRYSSK